MKTLTYILSSHPNLVALIISPALPRCPIGLYLAALGLLLQTPLAWAVCSNNTPAAGETVTCNTTAPNPDTIGVDIAAGNTGVTVNVLPGAGISPESDAIVSRGNGATITNQGTLTTEGESNVAIKIFFPDQNTVSNSGTITTSGEDAHAIELIESDGSTVTNSGAISTDGDDARTIRVEDSDNVTVSNTGSITTHGDSSAYGFEILNSSNNVSFNNSGSITTEGFITHGILTTTSTNINITNSGAITTSGIDADGVDFENNAGSNSTFINAVGGSVTSAQALAVRGFDGNERVENAGTLATGVSGGTAIDLAGGNDTLLLHPTSVITGNALSGDGTDAFILGGSGNGSFDVSEIGDTQKYQGFEIFQKDGASTWTLTGTGNQAWTINGGILSVNGTVGAVTVNANGSLQGSGTVGNLTVAGNIAPGNSIGTLNVNGNYTQAAGSTYTVETNAAGQSDLINVKGTATLQGGTVNVLAAAGDYNPKTTYTIVNTTGGVTGTFAGVTDNLPFLDASLIHNPSTVLLNLVRNDLTFGNPIVGQTPNQIAVASNLDRLEAGATGDLRTVFNKLVTGNTAQARRSLDDLGGEIHATGLSLDLNAHQVFLDGIRRQSVRQDSLGANSGSDLDSKGTPKPHDGVWLQGLGIGHGDMDSDGNASKTAYNTSGISVGGDTLVMPQLRLGGAFAATFSDANVNARNSSASSNGYHAAVYSSFRPSGATLSGQGLSGAAIDSSLSYAHFETDTSRGIRLGDTSRTSKADYGANLFAATTEGRYGLNVGGLSLEPYLGLRYQWLSRDRFRETGADSVNLVAGSNDQDSLRLGSGIRFGQNFNTPQNWLLRPEMRVGWEHEFLDNRGDLSAQFAGATGGVPGFTVLGVRTARDRAIFSAGLSVQVNPQVQLYADYTGWASGNEQAHGGIGGFRVNW